MQVYETPTMSSEMHSLISSGVESLGFSSRNMFLGNSEGEMSSRPNVMATSYQGLGNTAVGNWKSLNVQESRSNGVWAGPSLIIPSNMQGIVPYGGQNMVNSMLVGAAGGGGGGVSPSLDAKSDVEAAPQDVQTDAMQLYLMKPKYPNGYSEASSTASMMDVHPPSGLAPQAFESQKSFGKVRFNIPPVIQNAASEVSPSTQAVREPTHSQWQSAGSESDLPGKGNMQHNHLVLSHLNNTLNWSNRRTGSQSWSRDPFLENKVPEYISAGQEGSGQGLQLSLSFHQPPDIHLQGLGNHANVLQMDEDSKPKAEDLFRCTGGLPYISSPYSRDGLTTGKGMMNSIQGRPSIMHMNGGSMQGPFASHATSLKNSAYLKATQELLYEFCNVGLGIKTNNSPKRKPSSMSGNFVPGISSTRSTDFGAKSDDRMNQELFSGDRFELQRRKAKLLSMLEEVDRRYRHYFNQMQTIISSFESVTTVEAAGPYTALALKAMSRHFRCLRDAISSQVQLTSKCLGESDSVVPGTTRGETPRLGFLERSIRQQRALQQLGMMEQHPWRPQRGLPERSVSLLRAWLFEHFLHPYPTDADKHILARQTGLTRSQVSNWFINARVRLWKPMVEEMYMEETKEEQLNLSVTGDARGGQNAEEKARRSERSTRTNSEEKSAFKSGGSESQCTASEEAAAAFNSCSTASQTVQAERFGAVKFHHIPPSQHEMKNQQVTLVGESHESVSGMNVSQRDMKLDEASAYKNTEEDKGFRSELYTSKLQAPHETEMGLDLSSYNSTPASTMAAAYSYDELNPRHFANSGVSLTLGLHHSGGLSFPLSEDKYDNNIYFARDDTVNQYSMLDNAVSQENGYLEQELPYRNYGNGNRLLHDFVG